MKKIPFYLFTQDRFYSLVDRIISIANRFTIDDADFANLKTELARLLALLNNLLNSPSTVLKTNNINSADDAFNSAFIALKNLIKVFLNSDDSAEYNAAVLLNELVNNHNSQLYCLAISEQNAKAESLLADMKKPEYLAAQNTIGLVPFTTRLQDRLNKLKASIEDRTEFSSSLPSESTEAVCKDLRNVITNLMIYIEAKCIVSAEGDWKEMNKTIEIAIKESVTAAKSARNTTDKVSETTVQ